MSDWNAVLDAVSDLASLSLHDLPKRAPARPIDFPSPIVHLCQKSTVKFYDHRKATYYSLDNVLVPRSMNHDRTPLKGISRLRVQSSGDEAHRHIDRNVGYCVKRKLSSSTFGSVYKGFVVKRKRHQQTIVKPNKGLDVIREEDELLDSISEQYSNDNDDYDDEDGDDNEENFAWETTGDHVIIKTASWERIRRMRGKHLEDPLKEIQAMQLLEGSNFGDHHPHIMHSQVALQDQKYLYNITPYCKGGDLGGVVMDQINRKSRMDEKDATHWFRQILLALHHLQLKGVCHRKYIA
jgi:serine/threonine protein kinase